MNQTLFRRNVLFVIAGYAVTLAASTVVDSGWVTGRRPVINDVMPSRRLQNERGCRMKAVTKEQFKEIYFRLGNGATTGWDLEYWNKFFEDEKRSGMKYLLEEPATPAHTRMMIITDYGGNEYRLFFFTEEGEEAFFDFPGKN